MVYYCYTFNNKKILKLLKLCMRPFQVSGPCMNLRLLLMRFYFKDKWRTKEQTASQQLCTQDLNSAGVRRGPPHGPSVPGKPGSSLTSGPHCTHRTQPLSLLLRTALTDSSTAQLLPASSSWLADHFPEPISKRSVEIAHGQVPGIVLTHSALYRRVLFLAQSITLW